MSRSGFLQRLPHRLRRWLGALGVSRPAPTDAQWGPIDLRGKPPEGVQWKLVYRNPDGQERYPQPAELRKVIYECPPEYYANSGAASLYGSARDSRGVLVYSAHNTPHLCWFLEEPYGFHFAFDPPEGDRQLTYDGSGPQPRVEHCVGGQPIYLPRGCFVSRDLAWEVIEEFLRTQQPNPAVPWISSVELEALGIDWNEPD
jgi:hypothetical protein